MNMVLSNKYFVLLIASFIALCLMFVLATSNTLNTQSMLQATHLEQLAGPQDGSGG